MKLLIFCLIFAALTALACRATPNNGAANSAPQQSQPSAATNSEILPSTTVAAVDVPRLAGSSTAQLDKILGKPEIVKSIADPSPGEYRVYKIPNHPNGLAVRFYGDKALNFNLILSKPLPTAKEALQEIFGIDVGNAPPKINPREPLSEVWQGTFNGVRFVKVYAKRERENGVFIFVLAEVAE